MRKPELVAAIAEKTGMSRQKSDELLTTILDEITNALVTEKRVNLVGFGSFTQKQRRARAGINPRTGEAVQIAASNTVRFKPGKGLKEAVSL